MDSKFYVSYKAARLLKEKGYSAFTKSVYREFNPSDTLFFKHESRDWNNMISLYTAAPTKAEAIDWLDSKWMRINIIYDWIECKWYFTIINGSPTIKNITELEVSDSVFYKTRLEAEEAAIIKALELL